MIEEVERGGARRLMGPFAVGDARQAAILGRMEKRLARAGGDAAVVSSTARARVVPHAAREAAARTGRSTTGGRRSRDARSSPQPQAVRHGLRQDRDSR